MKFSEDSGICMNETEIEPGLVVKRKLTPTDVEVERYIVPLDKRGNNNKPVVNGEIK